MPVASSLDILGLPLPDAGVVFLVTLSVHVVGAGVSVVAGGLAASARKRLGRHPRAGNVYWFGLAVVFTTATVMAVIRWAHSWHLFVIACATFACATVGRYVRRREPTRWMAWHGALMSASYVLLLTGFYVDNGPHLPLWDQLPTIAYWTLPALIGLPLTLLALARNGAIRQPATTAGRG